MDSSNPFRDAFVSDGKCIWDYLMFLPVVEGKGNSHEFNIRIFVESLARLLVCLSLCHYVEPYYPYFWWYVGCVVLETPLLAPLRVQN
jgi:hypothetical protein